MEKQIFIKKMGEKIKQKRNKKKLTQQQLSQKIKYAPSTISSWENGKKVPSSYAVKELEKVLDTKF